MCEKSLTYSFQVTDTTGTALVSSFDPTLGSISIYYDADILLSGGVGVEFKDYTLEVIATAGNQVTAQVSSSITLRVLNPCYDANYVEIVTSPLPIGAPHSYTLYHYSVVDPYWFMTHDAWTYQTQPMTHQMCGTISYSATFEGIVADEFTFSSLVYHQTNRTFGIYSEDMGLIGSRTIELQAYLTDYPTIKTVDAPLGAINIHQTVEIEIVEPCSDPASFAATE